MQGKEPDRSGSNTISRRRFLRKLSLGGAGIALTYNAGLKSAAAQSNTVKTIPATSPESPFKITFGDGAISSLRKTNDRFDTDYIAEGHALGHVEITFRRPGKGWNSVKTAALDIEQAIFSSSSDFSNIEYEITDHDGPALKVLVRLQSKEQALTWTVSLWNVSPQRLEIGDLALPLPMNTNFHSGKPATATVLKHSFVSGSGSYMFWMRSNSVGPYLTMTPMPNTHLEYWERQGGFRAYIHSAVAGAIAEKKGCRWRQPNTSLILEPHGQSGDSGEYGFRFEWAKDYDGVRDILVANGLIDITVVPGMTVPADLFAQFTLRTNETIHGVDAEHPKSTEITYLGKNESRHLYQVKFSRLGENRLTVRHGFSRATHLEFFVTEPLETLIKKRGAFIAKHQHRNPGKWYNGLLAEWNMDSRTLLGPDNYDHITGWRIYEVTCDDPGLSKPAYLAGKNAEYPVQAEVEALDYYIEHFVWGGLQRTTEEAYPYGIYGIPDWKTNRNSADPGDKGKLHIWRVYDYPHIIAMYFGMYRVAKRNPQIKTNLTAAQYLERATGTAIAMFTVPDEIVKWSAYETGYYNELVIVDLIRELNDAGLPAKADQLRGHWERKVKYFVNDSPNLFSSEYPFDSTGFESTQAIARYAVDNADRPGSAEKSGIPIARAKQFMQTQMAANLFCRGCIEPAYYLLGSDYRGQGGDSYTLTYMSQMGGWAVLDYALHDATDPIPYIRLGYASYLSAWALMNTGTPESNFGYWYPGEGNDGGAGGGFEPAPYGKTWLDQPHHRGSWYYSSEIDLGYCGALRMAATILADDPIFGRFCFGGDWLKTKGGVAVVPKDGLRRRFHTILGRRRLSLLLDTDRFAAEQQIKLKEDFSEISFQLESDNPQPHPSPLRISGLPPGQYAVHGEAGQASISVAKTEDIMLTLAVGANAQNTLFTIVREK